MSATEPSFEVSSLNVFFFFFHQRDLKRAKFFLWVWGAAGCNNKRNVLPMSLGKQYLIQYQKNYSTFPLSVKMSYYSVKSFPNQEKGWVPRVSDLLKCPWVRYLSAPGALPPDWSRRGATGYIKMCLRIWLRQQWNLSCNKKTLYFCVSLRIAHNRARWCSPGTSGRSGGWVVPSLGPPWRR